MSSEPFTHEHLLHDPHGDDVHGWFNLTYANYLVLPRSLMQSMPGEWQERMVACLEEMEYHFGSVTPSYRVQAVDSNNRFMRDPVPHYNRGRTFIPPAASLASPPKLRP